MWSNYTLNVTLVLFFLLLILFAYLSQTTVDHPALSYQLLPAHRVLLTAEEELIDEPFLASAVVLPASVNLYARNGSSKIPVDDQGRFGSCTAHALRYAYNLWKMRLNPTGNLILPSRCFWYGASRMRLGDIPPLEDYGSTNEATIWALANKGSIAESAYPYTAENMVRGIPPITLSGGESGKTSEPVRFMFSSNAARNISSLQQCLADGQSIIAAIMVYTSFMTNSVMRTGVIPLPNTRTERLLGGHAICLTGYTGNFFTFRNSWGKNAGINGTFQIPMAYIGNWNLTGDAWIL